MDQNIWELQGSSLHRQVRRAEAVKSMLENSKAVLDVGCAEGFITSFLVDEQIYVAGVDLDESIKIAKNKVKKADFVYASITHLPFKDEYFDAVTLLEVLEHLPDNVLAEGVKEVDRILTMLRYVRSDHVLMTLDEVLNDETSDDGKLAIFNGRELADSLMKHA